MLFLAVSLLAISQPGAGEVLAKGADNVRCSTLPVSASECIGGDAGVHLEPVENTPLDASLVQSTPANQPEPSIQSEPLIPDAPYIDNQWALSKIEVSSLWQVATGTQEVLVAILDTGIDKNHEELRGQVIAEADFTDGTGSSDIYGHGTHVAGIIAAKNDGTGIVGVAPGCLLLNAKVADDMGRCQASALARGIIWAVDSGANVPLLVTMAASYRSILPIMEIALLWRQLSKMTAWLRYQTIVTG